MTFAQFLSILRARWWVAALVLGLAVAGTLAYSLWLPKQYTAKASVVVDSKPDPVSAVLYGGMASPAFMATQIDILNSERVALRVVRNLKLAENPEVRAQWQAATQGEGSIEQWLAGSFQNAMEAKPSRESNVITVSYKAPNPRFASGLANAFVEAYIQTALELRVDPARQYNTFFDSRAKEFRDALEAANTKVSTFQRANGIIASDERLDVENARLSELSSQLVGLQAVTSEANSRLAQAGGANGERLAEVLNNPVVSSLKADVSRGEARLQELNSRYGENHPQVVEARASIAELRSRVEAETRRVTGGVGVSASISRQREAELRASLEAQRSKVLKMKATRDEGSVLVRDVENAQRAYEAIVQRQNQSSLESQTTQSNIYVLTQATAPIAPSSPRVFLNTLVASLVGTVLAVLAALILEIRNRRVRSSDEIMPLLELPVLGVLPRPGKGLLGNRTSAMQRRLMAPAAKGAA